MLTFDLSPASGAEAGATVDAGDCTGVVAVGCVCASAWGSILAGSGLLSGVAGALVVEAFSVSPGGDSVFGSGFGAGGADSSGFAASRGAGGGRGGVTVGGAAAGEVFADGVLRSVAADFGLGFVESGASYEPNGLIAFGMRALVGPP
jgi:hypothetical protein